MLLQKCKKTDRFKSGKEIWSFDHECNRGNRVAHLMTEVLCFVVDIGCIESSCLCWLLSFCLSERVK